MDFIFNYAAEIGQILVLLFLAGWAIYAREWSRLQIIALSLMLSAERLLKTKEGTEKFEEVFREFWIAVPAWVKKFTDEVTIRKKLQDWYNIAKDYIKNGAITGI